LLPDITTTEITCALWEQWLDRELKEKDDKRRDEEHGDIMDGDDEDEDDDDYGDGGDKNKGHPPSVVVEPSSIEMISD